MSSHADFPLAVTFSSVNFTTCIRQPPARTFCFRWTAYATSDRGSPVIVQRLTQMPPHQRKGKR